MVDIAREEMPPAPPAPRLTRRETDVLAELCRPILDTDDLFTEPATIHDMAQRLVVSDAAIKQHLLHLYDKFEIVSGRGRRVLLANAALRCGAVRLPHPSPTRPLAGDLVSEGRAASTQRDWGAAFDLLSEADLGPDATLGPDELELLAEAGWFSDHHPESDDAGRRAHAAYLEDHDLEGAARVAVMLAYHSFCRLNLAIASGWISRGSRLVGATPSCKVAGDLAAQLALVHLAQGDLDAALTSAQRAVEIGEALDNPDALALGMTLQGYALVRLGRIREGVALLDEGMASASAGRLSATSLGLVYCRTLGACLDLHDYRRALEWADEVDHHRPYPAAGAFPGDCETHRVAVRIVRGEWREAELEATAAVNRTFRFDLNHTAEACNELGEIKLRIGDLDAADDAFARARELGSSAQPGTALLLLRRGAVREAFSSITAALAGVPSDPLSRAKLLPAQVEISLAASDPDGAAHSVSELGDIADRLHITALQAAAAHAAGCLTLGQTPAAAVATLQTAVRLWVSVGAPYEAARARHKLAEALLALDDQAGAAIELAAACSSFETLGARIDLERATTLLAGATHLAPSS